MNMKLFSSAITKPKTPFLTVARRIQTSTWTPISSQSTDLVVRERLVPEDLGVTRLRLNRPSARNALSFDVLRGLRDHLAQLRQDHFHKSPPGTRDRCVVISGSGPVFCSGHDLKEIESARKRPDHESLKAEYCDLFALCSEVMVQIAHLPLPVIAQVQGVATAAGCQLASSCDLTVATESARFATPGVNIGLFCSTPSIPIVRTIGRRRAMQMLLTGDFIDAKTALEWGLVSHVVPDDDLEEAVESLAKKIAAKSTTAIAFGKQAINEYEGKSLEESYDIASKVMTDNLLQRDANEGISAFLEKRAPNWE